MNEVTPAKNKGGRPRKEIDTNSPEFKSAVEAAVNAALPKIASMMAAARTGNPIAEAAGADDMDFVRKLALAIGEISDQGTQRKRVAPEILAKRAEARDKLMELLVQHRANGVIAHYRLIEQTYLDERLLHPFRNNSKTKEIEPVDIEWDGVPNEAMVPLDEPSTEVFNLFMESIGGMTVVAPTSDGRGFVPDSRPFSVTQRGVVVKGEINQRRAVSNLPDSNVNTTRDRLVSPRDPTAKEVRVLGTIAPPARQNSHGLTR